MRITPFLLACPIVFASALGRADSSDPVAARAQLQQGYALKQQGKCEEALPHFVESVRLDRQPKALMNLADCEEKLGKLAAAQTHFVEARDLARGQGLDQLKSYADQHLQALEKRMPKLLVRLAKDAPADTIVLRDGVELGRVSLNASLPADPGQHRVIAREKNLERRYDVTLAEAETKEIEVTPIGGTPMTTAATPVTSGPTSSPAEPSPKPSGAEQSTMVSVDQTSVVRGAGNRVQPHRGLHRDRSWGGWTRSRHGLRVESVQTERRHRFDLPDRPAVPSPGYGALQHGCRRGKGRSHRFAHWLWGRGRPRRDRRHSGLYSATRVEQRRLPAFAARGRHATCLRWHLVMPIRV